MKFLNILKEILKTIGKFLKYVYAPYMIMSLMCFIFYAFGHKVLGIGFLIVTVLLLINEIKQNNVKIGG